MKKLIMILMILILAGTAAAGWWETDSNLICWYKMDDNADSTVVIDSCGLSNGTFNGTDANTSAHHTTGKVGGALDFNGIDDYIDMNSSFQTTFQNDFAISLWVKPDDGQPPVTRGLIGCYAGGAVGWEIAQLTVSGKGLLSLIYSLGYTNGLNAIPVNSLMSDGQQDWHHIVVNIYQNGSIVTGEIYFDGSLVATAYTPADSYMSTYSNSYNPVMGAINQYGNIQEFDKTVLDNVMIFNKALSEDEITQLYNVNGHRNCVPLLMHNKRHRCD